LRILLLYEAVYPDNIGGVETRNWELGRALGRRGHEVTLAGFCAPLPGEPPNVRVLPMGPSPRLYNAGGRRSTRAALRFAAAVARLDLSPYDVVEILVNSEKYGGGGIYGLYSTVAADNLWGHYYVFCWSDTANGGGPCIGAPSNWAGAGGT